MTGRGALGQFPLGGGPFGSATVTTIGWFAQLTDPVRARPRSAAALAPFHFWEPAPSPFVATGWFEALAEPVRIKPGLKQTQQQFAALPDAFPFVSFSWFQGLSKPAKPTRPGLDPARQQFLAYQANPVTVTPFAWFANLSEPVRKKPGLAPALQQFFAIDTSVIPLHELMEWFAAFSEPVRFKPGLGPWLQQFYAAPVQLRPNPAISGVLSALETKDVLLAGGALFNRIVSGEIGVIEQSFTGAEIGIVEQAASAGTSGMIEQGVSPVPGVAVPTITSAHVSIRMV